MFSQLRKRESVRATSGRERGPSKQLHEAGEGGEELADVTGMFEAIIIMVSVALVSHHLGQSERCQHIAHARYASAYCASDLAGI